MAVKYFTDAHYWWNNTWNYGIEVNSYSGSLWRITNAAWNINIFRTSEFIFYPKNYTSGGTVTLNVSTDPNNSNQNASSNVVPATNAGYAITIPYTEAQQNILKSGGYLFIRTNFSVLFDGPAGSSVCYSYLDALFQNAWVRAGGIWRYGNMGPRVQGTWRDGFLSYVKVSGEWRTRGAG